MLDIHSLTHKYYNFFIFISYTVGQLKSSVGSTVSVSYGMAQRLGGWNDTVGE